MLPRSLKPADTDLINGKCLAIHTTSVQLTGEVRGRPMEGDSHGEVSLKLQVVFVFFSFLAEKIETALLQPALPVTMAWHL